ncbi:hypothetical protein X777_13345 [Ooceraea biroi]|uniref:MICOS complex subunit MIC13 n=1 Tax=Ooceraea biroi TaxID=2015173 RepID=A0A026WX00_OOCBI|nr:hypothetical protein X777_13345 [Ooceraea biroi]
MKRGTRCIAQTINLSDPKTCVRPTVQRLVSADKDSRTDTNRASNYCAPRPVTIKVCTRQDTQRKCPPKLCDCPAQLPPLSSGEKLCRLVMFLMKGAICTGLIYWTCSEGFWGDSTKTEDLYYRMMRSIAHAIDGRPPDASDLPHLDRMKYSALQVYNRMVVRCMDIIVSVPLEMHRKLRTILFPCDSAEKTTSTRLD